MAHPTAGTQVRGVGELGCGIVIWRGRAIIAEARQEGVPRRSDWRALLLALFFVVGRSSIASRIRLGRGKTAAVLVASSLARLADRPVTRPKPTCRSPSSRLVLARP